MVKTKEQLCAGVGVRVALLCAALGALVALVMMYVIFSPSEVSEALRAGWPMIAGGLAGLFLMAGVLGREAGRTISQRKRGYVGAIFIGIGVALCSLALAAFVGSVVGYAIQESGRSAGVGIIGIILFAGTYVMIYGFLPALLLGVLCGVLLRWRLTKAGC